MAPENEAPFAASLPQSASPAPEPVAPAPVAPPGLTEADVRKIVSDAIAQHLAPFTSRMDVIENADQGLKGWVRREIQMNASGVTEKERQQSNP